MNNQDLIELLKAGTAEWNKWKKSLPFSFAPQTISIVNAELNDADLSKADLSNVIFTNASFSNCSFHDAHMDSVSLMGSYLYLTNFVHASLNNSNLANSKIIACDFSNAYLRKANLSNIITEKYQKTIFVNFKESVLIEADLSDTDLQAADFFHTNMSLVNLQRSKLQKVNFLSANICFSNLKEANLTGAKLSFTHLAGSNFNETLLDNAEIDNSNLNLASFENASATKANFSDSNLSDSKCFRANFSGSNFARANLNQADFRNANLISTTLNNASFVETNLKGAKLTNSSIYGVSVWNIKVSKLTEQLNLQISKDSEPSITVDNIEIAQFINLLLHNEKIRDIINTVANKAVLILGRFTPERKNVLDFIKSKLREYDYIPILFDFEKPIKRDLTETIITLASLSKYIIADLSDPSSIPLELHAIVPNYAIPLVTIIEKGKRPFAMFFDLQKFGWVLETIIYPDISYLNENFEKLIINRAEAKVAELKSK